MHHVTKKQNYSTYFKETSQTPSERQYLLLWWDLLFGQFLFGDLSLGGREQIEE
jgi:hypothetical protein